MSEARAVPGPTAIQRARSVEDVMVGEEIVRHTLLSRVVHWVVASFFVLCVFTGLPIWSPIFGWMAAPFGGLSVVRWLHSWLGVAFAVTSVLMLLQWFKEMVFDANDRKFKVVEYLKFSAQPKYYVEYSKALGLIPANLKAAAQIPDWAPGGKYRVFLELAHRSCPACGQHKRNVG